LAAPSCFLGCFVHIAAFAIIHRYDKGAYVSDIA
jgi:hypothetical protein